MNPADETAIEYEDGEEGEIFSVGNTYEIKLSTGDEFTGIVLAYDPYVTKIVIFHGTMPEPGDSITTRMVKADCITESGFLGKFKDSLTAKKCLVNLSELESKETLAISQIERIGVGVTAEAQSIFDALSKTLPVKWENKDILVMREILVCSPYLTDCVTGGTSTANNQVKKVLREERKKLNLDI